MPGIAKKEDLLSGCVELVRKPAVVKLEISLDVKAVLATVVEVGLAFMAVRYFAGLTSILNQAVREVY